MLPPLFPRPLPSNIEAFFLNDEDWGLKPWAAKTFEKERGNIGPPYLCQNMRIVVTVESQSSGSCHASGVDRIL